MEKNKIDISKIWVVTKVLQSFVESDLELIEVQPIYTTTSKEKAITFASSLAFTMDNSTTFDEYSNNLFKDDEIVLIVNEDERSWDFDRVTIRIDEAPFGT